MATAQSYTSALKPGSYLWVGDLMPTVFAAGNCTIHFVFSGLLLYLDSGQVGTFAVTVSPARRS
jgi:hypothetical protein